MKNVLHIAYPGLNNSGVPNVIMAIVRGINDSYSFSVLVTDDNEDNYYTKEFERYGHIYYLKLNEKNRFNKIFRPIKLFCYLNKLFKQKKFDVVHAHNGYDAAIIMLASKLRKVPTRITHAHGTGYDKPKLLLRIYRSFSLSMINRFATHRVSCSFEAGSHFFKKEEGAIIVIKNSVDFNVFSLDLYPRIRNKEITFTIVGRFTEQKNHLFALDIFYEYLKINNNSILNIVGFGNLESSIRKKIIDLNIDGKVNILKHDTNVPLLLSETDIFLLPSLWEGLGIVLIEAQLMDVMCFTSDVVPIEANIGKCEYISLKLDARTWANKIENYLNSATKHYINDDKKNEYKPSEVMKDYLKLYG